MDKNNLELFKQAISEGLSNKFDSVANSHTEEIVCSEKHELAMRAIVYGKAEKKRVWTPKMKRIIAILVAAALLLTSCGIIFHNQIRDFVEDICDFFVAITYTNKDSAGFEIDEIYELTYVPEGYCLEEENISHTIIKLVFSNSNGDKMRFEQRILDGTDFVVDSENGYTKINDIQDYGVYYRFTNSNHVYVWNNGNYSMSLTSDQIITHEEIILIINGIQIK